MFTGIIEAIGTVRDMQPKGGDLRLTIASGKLDMSDVALGDSIAVNGVCLTAIAFDSSSFSADVSRETLSLTSLGNLNRGSSVNLEKALTLQTRLGGHLVSGHVDGLGEVVSRHDDARSVRFSIRAPDNLAKYIAAKGSITLDGTSLTVNKVDGSVFELNIVPHTLQETIIADYRSGSKVNLEVDVIARYLERLLLGDKAAEPATAGSGITEAFLAEHGFMK
ncbi:MAG: riboflavin synthase [Gammaproteobacteria bacterium]|nr:riboflavin synthase [Gammaproteobacteria bacterium]MBU1723224.1 riboflavin synthase [Gammaproteobacteria bacterium]MBU2007249.1 riboflavin synthase [Gammaproteobacteria bacterium]